MSLLPLAVTATLCLVYSCLVFAARDQARRSGRDAVRVPAPSGRGAAPRAG